MVIAAVIALAVARVAVPISAEGMVKFRNASLNLDLNHVFLYYINIYWSCLFKSIPIAFHRIFSFDLLPHYLIPTAVAFG